MHSLQPFLPCSKLNAQEITRSVWPEGDESIEASIGFALLEPAEAAPTSLPFPMLLGHLHNCGFRQTLRRYQCAIAHHLDTAPKHGPRPAAPPGFSSVFSTKCHRLSLDMRCKNWYRYPCVAHSQPRPLDVHRTSGRRAKNPRRFDRQSG